MGHEISTTALQLALAGAVVANGGMLVKPQIILARRKPGGEMEQIPPEAPQRAIRPETAILLRQMMEGVVLHGTGKSAILKGYTSAGKTGSAQIYAHVQLQLPGFCAGGKSADCSGGHPECDHQRIAGIRRRSGRAGFSRSGHGRASHAGCSQRFAR
jgi:cell division protein FtsI/penicillin-binding protein 2